MTRVACARVRALRVFSKYSSLTLSITTLSTLGISTLTSSTPTLNTPYSLYSYLSSPYKEIYKERFSSSLFPRLSLTSLLSVRSRYPLSSFHSLNVGYSKLFLNSSLSHGARGRARIRTCTRRFIYTPSLSPIGPSSHEGGGAGEARHARGKQLLKNY